MFEQDQNGLHMVSKEFLPEYFQKKMTQVIFYNNAYTHYSHNRKNPVYPHVFDYTMLPVDPSHFRTHAESTPTFQLTPST